MLLYLLGINHFDPLVPPLLRDELFRLSGCHADSPAFVAVEYDESIFRQIAAQRPEFVQLVRSRWPSMQTVDVQALVATLGYEGDAHLDVFPDVPTLWLDQGRHPIVPLNRYAHDRLGVYGTRGR